MKKLQVNVKYFYNNSIKVQQYFIYKSLYKNSTFLTCVRIYLKHFDAYLKYCYFEN